MSTTRTQREWGPSTEPAAPGAVRRRRSRKRVAAAAAATLIGYVVLGSAPGMGLLLMGAGIAYLTAPRWRRFWARYKVNKRFAAQPDAQLARAKDPATLLRHTTQQCGDGIFLGLGSAHREWITADPEQAVMVLGPPRSGKTTAVVIPAILSATGAVVSTSTKLDVFAATAAHRSTWGQVWVFDPSGTGEVPPGARPLRWSPVGTGRSWDETLTTAAAMIDASELGSTGGDAKYWNERAGAMLAALLHAAALDRRTIADVRAWVLRSDLIGPTVILQSRGATIAAEILDGLSRASDRALSSVFGTASSVLSAYNSEAALAHCERPNFHARSFADSTDTVFITAPAHLQVRLAPLVVGLLEEIRSAAYARARSAGGTRVRPLLWALDEVANIAPLKTLPAVVSEGGGQGLQILACFQDLSQARARWGSAADGFLSLFGTKLIFAGVGDPETLRALSTMIGTWDRPHMSVTESWGGSATRNDALTATTTRSRGGSVSISSQREAFLSEGDIANIPYGKALAMQTRQWTLMSAERWFESACWRNVISRGPQQIIAHPRGTDTVEEVPVEAS